MHKQRGIIAQGWLYLIAAIAIIGALAGLVKVWDSYTSGLIEQGRISGEATAKATYEARDNKALADAIAETKSTQAQLDWEKEKNRKGGAERVAAYNQGVKNAKAQFDRDVADLNSGALILRDPGKRTPALTGISNPAGGQDGTTGGGLSIAGAGDCRLSAESSGLVLWIAGEANRLRDKTNSLIDQVNRDRVQINGVAQ